MTNGGSSNVHWYNDMILACSAKAKAKTGALPRLQCSQSQNNHVLRSPFASLGKRDAVGDLLYQSLYKTSEQKIKTFRIPVQLWYSGLLCGGAQNSRLLSNPSQL
jgi:hypothetical protein